MVLSECLMAKPVWSKPTVAPFRVRALVDSIRECVWGTCNTSERIKSYPLFVLMVTLPTPVLLIIELSPRDISTPLLCIGGEIFNVGGEVLWCPTVHHPCNWLL